MNGYAEDPLKQWANRIDWRRRVKAVCKPCWELKYCPYGNLVEDFPLPEEPNPHSCRIFGHECPVFSVAEPFTETKELRNISRYIPRPVQIRVLKRENGVCRICNHPIRDDDIHFDHIIPWSKGGPTEENNIQLLCGTCNRNKSDRYEDDYLISSLRALTADPVDDGILEFLFFLVDFRHDFYGRCQRTPDATELAAEFNHGELTSYEVQGAAILADLDAVLSNPPPTKSKSRSSRVLSALRLRWGYVDLRRRTIQQAAGEHATPPEELAREDMRLVERLGWRIKNTTAECRKWLST